MKNLLYLLPFVLLLVLAVVSKAAPREEQPTPAGDLRSDTRPR